MPNWKKVVVSGSSAHLHSLNVSTDVTASNISSSGNIFGNLSENSSTSFKTVVVDPSTGQLYRTGSYGGGGGAGGSAFPFAGDGIISGSLLISSSNVGGVSTSSLTLQGSGSTIFDIQGSQGQLFSVTDDLIHDVFNVSDISGDTLLKVSGSGLVEIPVGNLSGSATSTASFGHYIGDGSELTGVSAFPFAGDAEITGSLIVSGSGGLKVKGPIEVSMTASSGVIPLSIKTISDLSSDVLIQIRDDGGSFDLMTFDSEGRFNMRGTSTDAEGAGFYSSQGGVVHDHVRMGFVSGKAHLSISANAGDKFKVLTNADNRSPMVGLTGRGTLALGTQVSAATLPNEARTNTMFIKTGTAPSTAEADNIQFFAQDVNSVAGTASPTFLTEDGTIIQLGVTSSLSYVSASAFKGDGSQLTNLPAASTPTLQEVTDQGSVTTNPITASGDISLPNSHQFINFINNAAIYGRTGGSYPGLQIASGNGSGNRIWLVDQVNTAGSVTASFVGLGKITGIHTIEPHTNHPLILRGGPGPNDSNDGVRIQSADASNVYINRFEIESDANTVDAYFTNINGLGINDTTPTAMLDVNGNINTTSDITASGHVSGSATSTASFGKFIGDGAQLTNLPASDPFPFTGDAQITGSLLLSGSLISIGIQKQADVTNTVMGPGAGGTSMDWNGTSAFGENILIGSGSGKSLTISTQNTFIGNLTGTSAGAGVSYNTLVGYKAGNRLYVGSHNTFVGRSAGGAALINGGNYNTFLGSGAGDNITSGDNNVFLGASAGTLIQEGSNNIGIGYEALYNSDTSGNNIAIGTSALKLLDVAGSSNTATDNIAIGHTAGASLTSGTKNIIIGSGSLAADNPSNQIRIGHADLHIISGSLETGDVIFHNTASAPNFSGSFQGDGSNLTGITATAGSTSGRVVFTTTNGELTSEAGFTYDATTDRLTVPNLTTTTFTASFITSSTIETSGSNIFGDEAGVDVQTLIGTTKITGSAQITGSTSILGNTQITGSLEILSAASKPPVKIYNAGTTTIVGFGDNSTRFQIPASGMATMVGFKMYSGILDGTLDGNSKVINKLDRLELGGYGFGGTSVIGMVSPAGTVTVPGNGFAMYPDDANGAGTVSPHFKTEDGSILTIATTSSLKRVTADSSQISGSGGLTVESSGSTVFEVIGSEGTLFTVDDDLDGTLLDVKDRSGIPVLQASASGEIYLGQSPQSLYTTAVISSTTADVTQSLYSLDTSSYGGAFFDYTAHSGSDARAGTVSSVWTPGGSVVFSETTTTHIGDTSNLNLVVHFSQSQAQLACYADTSQYNIKVITRAI